MSSSLTESARCCASIWASARTTGTRCSRPSCGKRCGICGRGEDDPVAVPLPRSGSTAHWRPISESFPVEMKRSGWMPHASKVDAEQMRLMFDLRRRILLAAVFGGHGLDVHRGAPYQGGQDKCKRLSLNGLGQSASISY